MHEKLWPKAKQALRLGVIVRSLVMARGEAPKRNAFWWTFRWSKIFLSNFKCQLKNKYAPVAKKLYKRIPFSCHTCPLPLLWHEFDNCLCNFLQYKVSCCLHMYFLWRHHLPPDKSENDQDIVTLIEWFTYCIGITVDIAF
jgi:hypothetical protein